MDRKDFVDLCKKGDEQALELLYKTYSGKMLKICLRYVPDRQIAQDLLHDGFIVIFTSISSLRNPEKLESWMGIVMKNIALRYLNQNNAANLIPLSEISDDDEPAESPFSADKKQPTLPLEEIKVTMPSVDKPLFTWTLPEDIIPGLPAEAKPFPLHRNRKAKKWKLMLAGSLGPQLAQNMYKLFATPRSDSDVGSAFPQEVSTWEEYYSYLSARSSSCFLSLG